MARAMKDLGVKINVQLDIPHRFKWPSNRTEWIEFIVLDHSSKAGVAETWLQERILNMFQEEMLYGPRRILVRFKRSSILVDGVSGRARNSEYPQQPHSDGGNGSIYWTLWRYQDVNSGRRNATPELYAEIHVLNSCFIRIPVTITTNEKLIATPSSAQSHLGHVRKPISPRPLLQSEINLFKGGMNHLGGKVCSR
ncbi:hypothetical protein BDZ45DRAFT_739719 [Acephala macrosclerotiorum]|nr:hypothetical protein BDZ45DRAFT_739719 [Acephala macrosclerotiorum]